MPLLAEALESGTDLTRARKAPESPIPAGAEDEAAEFLAEADDEDAVGASPRSGKTAEEAAGDSDIFSGSSGETEALSAEDRRHQRHRRHSA